MSALLNYLAEMEKTAERYSLDPSDPIHFGLRPLTAFPFAAAEAYAEIPAVEQACINVSAWAFLRRRYRASKSFERKARLTEGYVRAWHAYVQALLDTHLRYWLDMGLDEATEARITQQHAIQRDKLANVYATPTPLQANAADRVRNAGTQRKGLSYPWRKDRWTENAGAEAIVLAEMGYTST